MTYEQLQQQQEALKAQILEGLPPAGSIKQKAIDYCLDNINRGYEVAHYKEVLRKLTDRTSRLKK